MKRSHVYTWIAYQPNSSQATMAKSEDKCMMIDPA